MFVHFKVEEESCRVYLNGDDNSYTNREKFDSIATIKYLGEEIAYVYAALGSFPINACREILTHCERMGANEVRWEHKSKKNKVSTQNDN